MVFIILQKTAAFITGRKVMWILLGLAKEGYADMERDQLLGCVSRRILLLIIL